MQAIVGTYHFVWEFKFMLKTSYSAALLSASILFSTASIAKIIDTEIDKISYSLGVKTAESFTENSITINPESFYQGMLDKTENIKTALTEEEIEQTLRKFQENLIANSQSKQERIAAENLNKSNNFLENNKSQQGIVTLPSGLQYKIITEGNGKSPLLKDTVTVHYKGTLLDGTEFDSSYKRNKPATFPVSNLIKGWQEALQIMKTGAKWQLFIPPELAYGTSGQGPLIQPNSALIFEMELLSIKS